MLSISKVDGMLRLDGDDLVLLTPETADMAIYSIIIGEISHFIHIANNYEKQGLLHIFFFLSLKSHVNFYLMR